MKTKMESMLERVLTSVNTLSTEVVALKVEVVCLKKQNEIMAKGIEFLKNCHMHPNTKKTLNEILDRKGVEL